MRLVSWAVAFAGGDALGASGTAGGRAAVALTLAGAAALAATTALAGAPRLRLLRTLAGPILFLALGLLLGARTARTPPLDPQLAAALESDDPLAIEAVVLHGPEETGSGTRLVVALTAIGGAPA